ncbi:MAG: hypothetical protein C0399_02905 [Syntrophus sp. (in: bacteria)]|nr:hypothetical protein [Syntrophus sp. (in: bacteria)]
MNKKLVYGLLATTVFICLAILSWAATVPKEAQRHFDRGLAAVEVAKTPEDYAQAIEEFRKAQALAPDWPDVYYNLGLVQEKAGKYGDAVVNLKKYLQLAPNLNEAAEVKSLINKLEFKAEQEITKKVALDIYGSLSDSTKWRFVGEPSAYKNWVKGFRRDGDRILMTYDYRNDLGRWTTGTTYSDELSDKTLTLKYKIWFPNFCPSPDCGVFAQYNFEIVSKNKVQVKAVEVYPEIRPYVEQKTEHLTFEYIRIQM